MKTKNFAKIALLTLSLALIIGTLFAMSANAATTPEIANMNVKYTDKFCLVYAVPADTVKGGSATLYLYDEYPADGVDYIREYTVSKTTSPADSGLDYEAYLFYTDGVAAMALDKVFYSQVIDANKNASPVKSYSVVEYLYTRLADVDGEKNTDVQNGLYKSVIDFGTFAQKQFLTAEELAATTLISDYCYVSTEGCTVDGKTAAVLPQNKAFTVAGDNGALSGYTLKTYTSYDMTEGETVSEISGSSLILADVNRAHVIAGGSRIYKSNVETFENDVVGGKPAAMGYDASCLIYNTYGAGTTVGVVEDKVFGTSSKVTSVTGDFKYLYFTPKLGCDAAEATQYEISFDLKVDDTTIPEANKEAVSKRSSYAYHAIKFDIRDSSSALVTNPLRFDILADGTLRVSRNSLSLTVPVSIRTNEYNSFRIVVRSNVSGKSVIDVYINNFTDTPDASFETTYTANISGIDKAYFGAQVDANDLGATFYFDNVWCGFVK